MIPRLHFGGTWRQVGESKCVLGYKSLFNNVCERQGRMTLRDFRLATKECTGRTRLRNRAESPRVMR